VLVIEFWWRKTTLILTFLKEIELGKLGVNIKEERQIKKKLARKSSIKFEICLARCFL